MGPNSSAIIVIVEDRAVESMANAMNEYGAKIVTVTMGSQISGEMATVAAVNVGENGESAEEEKPAEAKPAAESTPAKA
jgi:predicted TIM-barrel enzyme